MGFIRYESLTAFIEQWEKLPDDVRRTYAADGKYPSSYGVDSWALGIEADECSAKARQGDAGITEKVRMGLDKLDLSKIAESYGIAWRPAVVGQRVSVGDYLTGNPMCMRRRMKTDAAVRHVHIYAETATSAYTKADQMLARGCAILGLIEALQTMRVSVDLTLVCDLGGHVPAEGNAPDGTVIQLIKVDSRPLNISECGFAVAHPGFTRVMLYSNIHHLGFRGQFSSLRYKYGMGGGHEGSPAYNRKMKEVLDMQPHDVYVPMLDPNQKVSKDPAGWIQEKIEQIAG